MGKATSDLKKEHESILFVLKILRKMLSGDKDNVDKVKYYSEVLYFFKIFVDQCHHGKEEKYLFVEMLKSGLSENEGLIRELIREHDIGRDYISAMNISLKSGEMSLFHFAVVEYMDMIKLHIDKENNDLFKKIDKLLNEAKQDEIFSKLEQHEEEVIGHGVHEELHSMIQKWAEEFKVD
ncbi:MAG: hemerythrin domain-containing protein [Clostridiaceae bacterium]